MFSFGMTAWQLVRPGLFVQHFVALEIIRGLERSEIAEDIRAFRAYPKEELHPPMTTNLEQQMKSSSE
jgi:hypothetical protein